MAGSSWPALTAGRKAKVSDLELRFDWLEGSLVPMNAGLQTTGTYNLGSSTYRWRTAYVETVNINGGTISGTSASTAIKLATGAAVNEFSTDGAMTGNSDLAVPTEKAVRTYVAVGAAANQTSAASGSRLTNLPTYLATLTITCDGHPIQVSAVATIYSQVRSADYVASGYLAVHRDGTALSGNLGYGHVEWPHTTTSLNFSSYLNVKISFVDTPATGTVTYTLTALGDPTSTTYTVTAWSFMVQEIKI